jgi:4-hydroxythreonine-4-phosphate dehydrogenase
LEDKIKVGISVGDINGIGMEVILKTFSDALVLESCIPVIYGSSKLASFYKKTTGLNDLNFNIIRKAEDATAKKINIINVWEEEVKVEPGVSSANIGIYAFRSLEAVTHDIASNKVDVMVTAPINKHNIHSEKFPFPGHTEYLANYANADSYLMILCSDEIRIGCVTGHVAVKEVAANLSAGKILEKIIVLNRSLV